MPARKLKKQSKYSQRLSRARTKLTLAAIAVRRLKGAWFTICNRSWG